MFTKWRNTYGMAVTNKAASLNDIPDKSRGLFPVDVQAFWEWFYANCLCGCRTISYCHYENEVHEVQNHTYNCSANATNSVVPVGSLEGKPSGCWRAYSISPLGPWLFRVSPVGVPSSLIYSKNFRTRWLAISLAFGVVLLRSVSVIFGGGLLRSHQYKRKLPKKFWWWNRGPVHCKLLFTIQGVAPNVLKGEINFGTLTWSLIRNRPMTQHVVRFLWTSFSRVNLQRLRGTHLINLVATWWNE